MASREPPLAWLGLALLLALACDGAERPRNPASFCATWRGFSPERRDAFLDREVREWASENESSAGARFVACMAERVREQAAEITQACDSGLGDAGAYAVLGRMVVTSGQVCLGIDMH